MEIGTEAAQFLFFLGIHKWNFRCSAVHRKYINGIFVAVQCIGINMVMKVRFQLLFPQIFV